MDWTLGKLLAWAGPYLEKYGVDSPRLSAELMLGRVMGLSRLALYLNFEKPLTSAELAEFKKLLIRRREGEPMAYIMGRREFYGLDFKVGPGVLIPRPESEHLVEEGIRLLQDAPEPHILDLCTGSGAVALALASALPQARVWAVDISEKALHYARLNAGNHGLEVNWLLGDLWQPLAACGVFFDLITANPPYVTTAEWRGLSAEIKNFEPQNALLGGEDGLDIIREIINGARAFLRPLACLLIEIGAGQAAPVARLAEGAAIYRDIGFVNDLAGHQRVLKCQRSDYGSIDN